MIRTFLGGQRAYLLMLFVIGLCFILTFNFKVPENSYEFAIFITSIVLTVTALLLYLFNRLELYHYISIITVVYGVCTLVISYIGSNSDYLEISIASLAKLILSIIMIITGIMLYTGERYNIHRLKYVFAGTAIALVVPLIINVAYSDNTLWTEIVNSKNDMFMLLYVGVIFLMINNEKVRYYSDFKKIKTDIFGIGNQKMSGKDLCVMRADLLAFMSDDAWTDVGVGPIRRQKTLRVILKSSDANFVISEWDDGVLRADIVQSNVDTHIQAVHFDYIDLLTDDTADKCTRITVYGKDGFFFTLPVEDELAEMNNNRLHKVLKYLINYQE